MRCSGTNGPVLSSGPDGGPPFEAKGGQTPVRVLEGIVRIAFVMMRSSQDTLTVITPELTP